jgi:hypothetical protein
MIAEFLKIPASTVHLYLTTSLNMKSRHYKQVSHFLDDDLRAKRLVHLDIKLGTAWLPADAELPVHVKRTIGSAKRMLIVLWGIHGMAAIAGSRKIAH